MASGTSAEAGEHSGGPDAAPNVCDPAGSGQRSA
jgi:hypothetical protein